MTEAEWMVSRNPTRMLEYLRGKVGDRKLRLLGVSIVRASWDRIEDDRTRRAVLTAEAFADGLIDASALEAIVNDAWDVRDELWDAGPASHDDRLWIAEAAALTASVYEWRNTFTGPGPFDGYPFHPPSPGHCDLIRDILGNPFAPVAFDPGWRTEAVVGLARGMYEGRDFGFMPVLADALAAAGCAAADVLAHCLGAGPHVRGCWVVDLVLGRS